MSIEEAVAKARQIAAKLSGLAGAGGGGVDLGKRKFDDFGAPGLGSIKRKKVYIPVNQFPDVNFLGLLIGPKGSTQKLLQEKTGAKILIRGKGSQKDVSSSHPDDDDDLHVTIEGSEESVEAASKEVEQILYNPEEAMKLKGEQLRSLSTYSGSTSSYNPGEYQEELKVPNSMVGLIIGRGGENIQKLQGQTGAHIQIAKESEMKPGDTHRSIFLRGDRGGVAELKSRIEDIISARSTTGRGINADASKLDTPIVMKVPVPNERVGYIIGKGGMNIRTIQEKTRTQILIPQGPDENDPNTRTLSIGADTREAAEAAHAEIVSTLHQFAQNAQGAGTVLICIPDDKVGIVIGRGGSNIKDLQARHKVRIQIPTQADPGSNPPVRTCTIQGSQESQHAARYEIEMILQGHGQSNQTYSSYSSANDPSYTAALYGQQQPAPYDPNAYAYAYYGQTAATAATATTAPTTETPVDPTAYYNDFWKYASYYGEAAARQYYGAWSPPEGTPPPAGITIPPNAGATQEPAKADSQPVTSNTASAESSTASVAETSQSGDAWEAYKKQYAEWYEAHGKFVGADPNPPAM